MGAARGGLRGAGSARRGVVAQLAAWFARRGILVGPGEFYGAAGERHVRVALTAPDDFVAEAVSRITST